MERDLLGHYLSNVRQSELQAGKADPHVSKLKLEVNLSTNDMVLVHPGHGRTIGMMPKQRREMSFIAEWFKQREWKKSVQEGEKEGA